MPAGFLPSAGTIQRSFGGGELAPALHARADQVKYVNGLKTCRNFQVLRAGGIQNRAGTRYVGTCKTNSPTVQLIPYLSEVTGESILIENGASYFRFFKNGAAVTIAVPPAYNNATAYVIGDIVLSGGVNYYCIAPTVGNAPPNVTFWYAMPAGNLLELPSPFSALCDWSQQGRVLTLTHEDVNPYELTYEAVTRWTIVKLVTGPKVIPPPGLGVVAGAAGARTMAYLVTAASALYEESNRSGIGVLLACAQPTDAAPNVISWTLVAGAPEYYVYCDPYNNGTFGYIGTSTGASFNDVGFVPDFSVTPPVSVTRFNAANDFPKCSTAFQQRRVFGYTKTTPDGIDASRVGYPSNFGISSPLQDDDALRFRLAGRQHQPVRHLIGLKQLIVMTDAGEWNIRGGDNGVLTPNAIVPDQQTYAGCATVRPVVVGNSIIYVQARGSIVRDLQFNVEVEGLAGRDMTTFSSHLFDNHTIRKMDYAQTPHSIVWAVRDDGVLLGCTYLREQDVWGWHRHDTDGFFWDACVVAEASGDTVYFIVRRTVNGSTVRYIEKLERRDFVPAAFDTSAFFVDAGLSYTGAAVNTVGGLGHLEAKRVAVLGDGAVISDGVTGTAYTVVAGVTSPAFPATYTNIHVGLPITAEMETLDLDAAGSDVRGKKKAIGPLGALLERSARTFSAGMDSGHLRKYTGPAWDGVADEFTGQVELNVAKTFDKYGRVLIRHTDPLPLTILGVLPDVELGG